jgi:hypothetical protein
VEGEGTRGDSSFHSVLSWPLKRNRLDTGVRLSLFMTCLVYFHHASSPPDPSFSPAPRASFVVRFIRQRGFFHSRRIRGPVFADRGWMLDHNRARQYGVWTHQPRQRVSNGRTSCLRIPPALAVYRVHLFGRTGGGHRDRTAALNRDEIHRHWYFRIRSMLPQSNSRHD